MPLFGERNKVRDSHDWYATMKVNYLLHRDNPPRRIVQCRSGEPYPRDELTTRRTHARGTRNCMQAIRA
jgi:hypothetical protein